MGALAAEPVGREIEDDSTAILGSVFVQLGPSVSRYSCRVYIDESGEEGFVFNPDGTNTSVPESN